MDDRTIAWWRLRSLGQTARRGAHLRAGVRAGPDNGVQDTRHVLDVDRLRPRGRPTTVGMAVAAGRFRAFLGRPASLSVDAATV